MSSKEAKVEDECKGGSCKHAWSIKAAFDKSFETLGKEKRFFPLKRNGNTTGTSIEK